MAMHTWILFVILDLVMDLTPGPAVLLISTQGLKYGFKHSLFGILGILTVNALYFFLSSLGIISLISSVSNMLEIVKYVGAAYLAFIGIKMIYNSFKNTETITVVVKETSYSKLYYQGLITQLSNPKAIIYFMALLPQFIDPKQPLPLQFIILALTGLVVEITVLSSYGLLAARSKKLFKQNSRYVKIQDRVAGVALIGVGWRLVG